MRAFLILVGIVILVVVALMALGMINVNQTRDAVLPTVKVEGGQAPKFNADVGHIDVGTVNKTVEVPVVDVKRADNSTTPHK